MAVMDLLAKLRPKTYTVFLRYTTKAPRNSFRPNYSINSWWRSWRSRSCWTRTWIIMTSLRTCSRGSIWSCKSIKIMKRSVLLKVTTQPRISRKSSKTLTTRSQHRRKLQSNCQNRKVWPKRGQTRRRVTIWLHGKTLRKKLLSCSDQLLSLTPNSYKMSSWNEYASFTRKGSQRWGIPAKTVRKLKEKKLRSIGNSRE